MQQIQVTERQYDLLFQAVVSRHLATEAAGDKPLAKEYWHLFMLLIEQLVRAKRRGK